MSYYLSSRFSHVVIGGIRGLVRLLIFALAFAGAAAFSIALRALLSGPYHRRVARQARMLMGKTLTLAAGVRIRRSGTPPATRGMAVSNHLSWLDSFVFLGEFGPRFVASSTWGAVPLLRTAMRATGVTFIERTSLADIRAVGAEVRSLIAEDQMPMIYPEANTSRGETVLPFRPGLLEPAADLQAPVWWMSLRYLTPPGWPPASVVISWADWTPLPLHIYRAFHVPYCVAQVTYGEAPVTGFANRKPLAEELHRRARNAFRPQAQLPPAAVASLHRPPAQPPPRF